MLGFYGGKGGALCSWLARAPYKGNWGCPVFMAGWSASYGSKAGALGSWLAGAPAFLLKISLPELPHRLYSL